jgi:manganese/zinc/iron transport system substrate-binding protein
MTRFKKFFLRFKTKAYGSCLVATLLMVSFTFFSGCQSGQTRGSYLKAWMEDSGKLRILCTTAQVGDLVSRIGGDRAKTWVLIQGDLDPHSYELVKGDDEKFFRSDVIFYNGLNLEHGASLSSQLRLSSKAVALGDSIREKYPETILQRGNVVDPHLWMDISIWKLAIDPIVERLSALDPEGAEYYRSNGDLLALKMEQVHCEIKDKLQKIDPSKRYLMTSHDAFRYFTRIYLAPEGETHWESRFAAPEGLAPEGQLSPVDIQRMIDFVRTHRITTLFPESNISRDSIKKIASAGRELGFEVRVCNETLYGDSMSGLSYLEMMQKNADVIARHLE